MSKPALAILAAVLGCLPGAALAQNAPAAPLVEALKAADAGGGAPPRLSDPAAAPMIRAAFDRSRLEAEPMAGMEDFDRLCGTAVQAMMGYMLFDLDREGLVDQSTQAGAATVLRVMNDNGVRFRDEAVLGSAYAVRCNVEASKLLTTFIEPSRWKGGPRSADKAPLASAGD